MYPHERSLVKAMKNRPFSLIGVNSDRDLKKLKKVIEKNKITWRSFQDRPDDKTCISRTWGVRGWPTLFLVDHKGIIRKKWVGNPGNDVLDKEIEALVKAAEAHRKGGEKKKAVGEGDKRG